VTKAFTVETQSWIATSAWSLPISHAVGVLISLNHVHFLATKNPAFAVRALRIGQHLSPDDGRLAWARDCFTQSIKELDALIDKPPKDHWNAVIKAFGFSMRRNYNPFREVHKILERDNIYIAVLTFRRHGTPLSGDTGAFRKVSDDFGISESKVRQIWYATQKLLDKPC
jgi:hypothetical protein